jgi:hypothetical protein
MNDDKELHHAGVQILLFDYFDIWESLISHKLFLQYMRGLNYIYSSQDTFV